MKACLFLHRRYTQIGHALAVNLKKLGIAEFCAYVSFRPPYDFLISQKDIKYTALLLDQDLQSQSEKEILDLEFIKNLEKKYGIPNLWPYLYNDRTIMMGIPPREYQWSPKPPFSHEEMMKAIQVRAKAIIAMLEKEKPDFIFMAVVNNLGPTLLYHIAKKMGIRTVLLSPTRIGIKWNLSGDYKTFTETNKIFEDYQNGIRKNNHREEAIKFLETFRANPSPYFKRYIPQSGYTKTFKSFFWLIKSSLKYIFKKNKGFDDEIPWLTFWDKIQTKMRNLYGFSDFYFEPNYKEDYAFYTLHEEPEMATLLYAPHYTDQIQVIKQIARSLPLHFKLYVKEHPYMVGYRPRAYYKELLKIPNVCLINPNLKSFELTSNAKIVFGITATANWEAILLKKPAISFGETFYNKLSMVKRCSSYENLPFLTKQQLENFHYNEEELINFISAILEDSVEADIVNLWEGPAMTNEKMYENEGITRLAAFLIKYLKNS